MTDLSMRVAEAVRQQAQNLALEHKKTASNTCEQKRAFLVAIDIEGIDIESIVASVTAEVERQSSACKNCDGKCSCDKPETPKPLAIPPGWKLVPVAPTEEMLVAGQEAWIEYYKQQPLEECVEAEKTYRAMIAAAPEYKEG